VKASENSPTISSLEVTSDTNFHTDGPVTIQVLANDPDGETLRYQFSVNGTIIRAWQDAAQTTWQPQPADVGTQSITAEAKDPGGAAAQQSTTIHLFRTPLRP
jgi:hypothetical protein